MRQSKTTKHLLALGLLALITSLTVTAQEVERGQLADEMRASLHQDLLALWYPLAVDTVYGGFLSDLTHDWRPEGPQDKFVVTQARHVWSTAEAARFFPEQADTYRSMSREGVAFLRDHMWDDEHGGFISLVHRDGSPAPSDNAFTGPKTAYGNAFAIYGLAASYEATGDVATLDLARRAYRWFDEHAHDAEHGGFFQFMEHDGTPMPDGFGDSPPKDQNSSIHILEALTALYGVWPDPVLRERLEEMLVLVRDTITTEPGYLQLFFQRDWTPVSYRESSEAVREAYYEFDHVSFGHDVETAFLMLEAAQLLGIDEEPTLTAGKRMVDHALENGWDDDVGGFYDGGYYEEVGGPISIVRPTKAWWSQAEGLNALLLMADRFPNDPHAYYDRFEEMWAYIQQYLIDEEHGGWYVGGIDQQPEARTAPKGTIWKGTYHNARALMHVAEQLEGHQ